MKKISLFSNLTDPSGKGVDVLNDLSQEASNWIFYFLKIGVPIIGILMIGALIVFATLFGMASNPEKKESYKKNLKIVAIAFVIIIVAVTAIPLIIGKLSGLF
ncbi:Mbov_0395 family pilin-like conjugal transfer protein [[Mycoplasma] collis]|uniref:Mbov_0395 family pilin-like conjugal transfer protein n=1 Tax=[Mycoplasma] collis TaxID=2127 RepID=UPI00051BA13E|nr:hypothetical protein [[Mycoplasma] collis]